MTAGEVLRRAGVEPVAPFAVQDIELRGLSHDSRHVRPGSLFVAYPGGERYFAAARENGAQAVLVADDAAYQAARAAGLEPVLPADFRDAVWRICDALLEHPTRGMTVVGVTGTNGKTTVAWLVRDLLAALGRKAGYLGTLGFQLPNGARELANTTPFAVGLYNLLVEARDAGVEALAMEVSSHALAEQRADGVEFDVGVFTNLTQDHLDYHGTMESYEAAKRRLFVELPHLSEKDFTACLNMEDGAAARLAEELAGQRRVIQFSSRNDSYEVGVRNLRVGLTKIEGELVFEGAGENFVAALGGTHNAENLISASAAVLALGFPLGDVASAIKTVRPVPGRFEPVVNDAGIGVLVDYAHTPDALEKLLDAVRPLTAGRVITVFGCGGDRDRTKRPLMAREVSLRSDLTVVTSDNPRTEDPAAIVADILPGLAPDAAHEVVLDRAEAVAYAVGRASAGDTVVIAGKGHENYQIVGRDKMPMDDRELARAALSRR